MNLINFTKSKIYIYFMFSQDQLENPNSLPTVSNDLDLFNHEVLNHIISTLLVAFCILR